MGTTNNRREEKCVQVYWGDDMRKGKFLLGLSEHRRHKEEEVEKAPTNTCLCFSASSKSNLFSFLCFQLSDETSWFICLSGRPWFRFRKKSFLHKHWSFFTKNSLAVFILNHKCLNKGRSCSSSGRAVNLRSGWPGFKSDWELSFCCFFFFLHCSGLFKKFELS